MENYNSDHWKQLFKHKTSGQVIHLDKETDDNDVVLYQLFDTLKLTMTAMKASNWYPIENSTYIGNPK